MIEALFNRGSVPVLNALLNYAGARHRAIAGNVANVDTAGYRTLDVPAAAFDAALARAFQERKASTTGVFEVRGDVLGLAPSGDAGTLKLTGNNVDLDLEMAKMVRNQSLHATAAALLSQQFAMMREAISGHVTA
jgi:flagellar basal-body rod protein FlgB